MTIKYIAPMIDKAVPIDRLKTEGAGAISFSSPIVDNNIIWHIIPNKGLVHAES